MANFMATVPVMVTVGIGRNNGRRWVTVRIASHNGRCYFAE